MKTWFVINPEAGRVREPGLTEQLRREFPDDDVRFVQVSPSRAEIASAGPRARVVAVGGDGTVQHVLRALGDPVPCPVGILPLGTSNDLARSVGIPIDFHDACAVLRDGHTRRIDLMEVNGIPFATAGGIGLPAAIAARADRLRGGKGLGARVFRRLRQVVYIVAAILEIAGQWRPIPGRLEGVPDTASDTAPEVPTRPWAVVLISNGPITGGFRASPEADIRDGQLDLFTIEAPRSRLRLGWVVLRTRLGCAAGCREVQGSRRRRMTLVTPRPVPFFGDGEILLRDRCFDIRVRPLALPLVTPVIPTSTRCRCA